VILRGRPAGGGRKPPQAAAVKSRGGERLRKRRAVSASGEDQEGERKRTTEDVSKGLDDIETGVGNWLRDEPGGSLLTGQVVSGMKVARAWSGLRCGTWEPVVSAPVGDQWRQSGPAVVGGRESLKRRIREGLRTDAGHRGGPARSSDEGSVMGPERRGRIILACLLVNRGDVGRAG